MPMLIPKTNEEDAQAVGDSSYDATGARPPHVTQQNLGDPLSRDDSRARADQLNAGQAGQEETVSILPHPARSNNPDELKEISGDPTADATKARPPHILGDEQAKALGEPLSRDEIRKRADELNS